MKKVTEIKEEFDNCTKQNLKELILKYENDDRNGVKKIVSSHKKKLEAYYKELIRQKEMSQYEDLYIENGYKYIAGIDEVGRGPLAGPVVACALIYPEGIFLEGVNDSKQLSEKKRNEIFWAIEKSTADMGLGIIEPAVVDEINILNATKSAMAEAVKNLKLTPDVLLIDALSLPEVDIEQKPIIKGDEKSITIAAASIVAKVMRDEMMYKYALEYPQYGFDKNKGYGTGEHIDALKKYGPCPIHRRSFIKNFL